MSDYPKEEPEKQAVAADQAKPKPKHVYWKLFISTFFISAFTFGGGYVIIPLMKKKFVDELHWIAEDEILDLIAIAQSSPGAVAINASFLLGYDVAGVPGAFVTILGSVMPCLIILTVISFFYTAFQSNRIVKAVLKGMQAGVAATIIDVVINLGRNVIKTRDAVSYFIMIATFVVTFILKVNVVYTILVCALIGLARIMLTGRKKEVN
ncbi:MAG: chromate transporter [Fusobacteriaceae bacterium]|jgi:chromate transporter|nr:chromate transporter [Fusobacteriaceae bacterium]